MNEKSLKNLKLLLEESRGMAVAQTEDPQTVEGEWIFSGKRHLNYRYIRYQPMKQSYYKIICFQNFPFDEELWLRSRCLTNKVLKWGRRIFSAGCGSLVREEFLKQPVGNSNIHDLKLENGMSGEFSVMIVQTLETWTNGQRKDLSFN